MDPNASLLISRVEVLSLFSEFLERGLGSLFLLAGIKFSDDSWVPAYAKNVHKLVKRQGGKYLSRSGNITAIEGAQKDCSVVAFIQFNSKDALLAFVNDPEYQSYAKARQAGSVSQFYMIDDTGFAGTVSYLPAA